MREKGEDEGANNDQVMAAKLVRRGRARNGM